MITVMKIIAMRRVSCKDKILTTVNLKETVKKVLIGAVQFSQLAIKREVQKYVGHLPRWEVAPMTTFTT